MTQISGNFKAKGLPWFRMYAEFATDPKVQMLSEVEQRRFVMLLCLRCSNGDVTVSDDEIAFQLRISSDDAKATKAVLVGKGLIDEAWQPTNWQKRQQPSDSSKSRVSAHRERKKQECNVDVTAAKRSRNGTGLDSELEEEKENTPVHSEQVAAPAKADGRTKIFDELKSAYNGTTEAMLAFIDETMGGNSRPNAEQWLASTTSAHGSSAVAQAFASLAEKRAAGEVIARPLPLWSSIAAGMKAGQAPKRQPAWAAEQEARRKAAREAVFGTGGTA